MDTCFTRQSTCKATRPPAGAPAGGGGHASALPSRVGVQAATHAAHWALPAGLACGCFLNADPRCGSIAVSTAGTAAPPRRPDPQHACPCLLLAAVPLVPANPPPRAPCHGPLLQPRHRGAAELCAGGAAPLPAGAAGQGGAQAPAGVNLRRAPLPGRVPPAEPGTSCRVTFRAWKCPHACTNSRPIHPAMQRMCRVNIVGPAMPLAARLGLICITLMAFTSLIVAVKLEQR